ncbi:MAG TPA: FtsW/RodA/SpoVE family cell cycle protein [Roseiflexaceae bacterium]|jgi:cell division protein FtsW (lipid II flippase)|nr:FtsW/RodA/SpoVE family cell cycle protein [Roseiflexaceae bacterium]
MFQWFRRLRSIELQLLLTALIFFAVGYVLVVAVIRSSEFIPTARGVADILWPSVLPFLLFIAVSLVMAWRVPRADQIVLPLVALLAGLGLLLMARLEPSLSAAQPAAYTGIDSKQSLWVTLGVGVLGAILFVPWDDILRRTQSTSLMVWLAHHRYVWLAVGIALILATFFFGSDPNNSGVKAWFNFGLFYFQPSELLKIILVIFLASYLDEHREVVAGGYRVGPLTLPPLPYLVPLIGMWGIAMGLIVFQRDLGAALLLFTVFLAMLYVATSNGLYVVAGLTAFGVGSYVLYQVISIVKTRVTIWLDPWSQDLGYQLVQAIYALASGGVFGEGLGQGMPTVVPAAHTDFIFTAIGEELGLAGTLAVLIAYILLIFRGYHIALSVPGRFRGFEQLLAVGLTTILAVQTFIIVGGNLRLIPLTGITLPFVSYGGSSVLMNFLIVGLLLRISAGER